MQAYNSVAYFKLTVKLEVLHDNSKTPLMFTDQDCLMLALSPASIHEMDHPMSFKYQKLTAVPLLK